MVFAESPLSSSYNSLEKLLGLSKAALTLVDERQIVERTQRVRMILAEDALACSGNSLVEVLCLPQTPLMVGTLSAKLFSDASVSG